MPEAAKQETPVGAEAFVASYVQAVDWAYSTTDSTILKPYFGANCTGCSNASGVFDDAKAAGQHYIGGHLTVKGTSRTELPGQAATDQIINVTISAAELQTLDNKNKIVETDAPIVADFQYAVHWTDGAWRMVRISYVPPSANA